MRAAVALRFAWWRPELAVFTQDAHVGSELRGNSTDCIIAPPLTISWIDHDPLLDVLSLNNVWNTMCIFASFATLEHVSLSPGAHATYQHPSPP